jgi:hypothetical protein
MRGLNESFLFLLFNFPSQAACRGEIKMQRMAKIPVYSLVAATIIVGFALSQPLAFAAGSSGSFNPQTQFPVGSTITFTSLNGAAAVQDNLTRPRFTQSISAFTITAQVINVTRDGGIRWKVLSGAFTINDQTYTVTNGEGHMNAFDEIGSGMDGRAIGPDGATYQWRLNGITSLYNGVVVAGLRGGIATIEGNNAILRYRLAFVAIMSA